LKKDILIPEVDVKRLIENPTKPFHHRNKLFYKLTEEMTYKHSITESDTFEMHQCSQLGLLNHSYHSTAISRHFLDHEKVRKQRKSNVRTTARRIF
jgi:hypothetical protein